MKSVRKLFILHGWTYSTEKWEPFLALLRKQGIEPVMLVIPGLTAPLTEVWTLENYVQWLKEIGDKEKGKVVLLGHSNGGRISIAFAAKYPEKVARLILIDSAGIYHNELPIRLKRFVFKTIAKIGKKLHKSERLRHLLYRFVREYDYYRASPIIRETMKNLIKVDLIPLLSQITVPAVIIWGGKDKITPLEDGKKMQEVLGDARLHILKEARHSPQFTHAEKVAEIINKELRSKN